MSHDHGHGSAGSRHAGRLWIALALTGSFMLIEATAGFITGSLVLIADAGAYGFTMANAYNLRALPKEEVLDV